MSSSTTTRGKSDGFSLESLSIYYQHILKERPCSLDLRPKRRILLVGGPGGEHTSTLQNRQTKLNIYPKYQITYYSRFSSHRNRPAGGNQSISKCAREIGPTVSPFLNVHGKFRDVSIKVT